MKGCHIIILFISNLERWDDGLEMHQCYPTYRLNRKEEVGLEKYKRES